LSAHPRFSKDPPASADLPRTRTGRTVVAATSRCGWTGTSCRRTSGPCPSSAAPVRRSRRPPRSASAMGTAVEEPG